jgi:hypothetical protein
VNGGELPIIAPYLSAAVEPSVFILGINGANQLVGIRQVPATNSDAELSNAITETAAALAALSILLVGVRLPQRAQIAMDIAEWCAGEGLVLDRVQL